MGHHQQNLILTVQFLKNDQCPLCCVAVRFSGTLVQPVNCEFFFTWIAVLRRQVDAKTVNLFLISCLDLGICINISANTWYFCSFCLTFFNQHAIKENLMHFFAIFLWRDVASHTEMINLPFGKCPKAAAQLPQTGYPKKLILYIGFIHRFSQGQKRSFRGFRSINPRNVFLKKFNFCCKQKANWILPLKNGPEPAINWKPKTGQWIT